MKITLVGGGNLSTALAGGLAAADRTDLEVRIVERNEDKRTALTKRYGVATQAALDAVAVRADVLVMAVKPKDIARLARELAPWLTDQVVVSVAAGIRTATLTNWLGGYTRLVWAMPNTAALVGRAVTGIYATPCVTAAERSMVQTVFETVGITQWLADESKMDALTAISGCGPAYIYRFVESLEAAACGLGFGVETARSLALHTLCGASWLLEQTGEGPTRLREKVSTPGGVTEQAIASLRESDLDGVLALAVAKALTRSRTMGEQLQRAQCTETTGEARGSIPPPSALEGPNVER